MNKEFKISLIRQLLGNFNSNHMNKPGVLVPVGGTRLGWLLKAFVILTFNSVTLEHQKTPKPNPKPTEKYFVPNTQLI